VQLLRGNGCYGDPVFFEPPDYALYRDLLAERCRKASVEVWAYARCGAEI
jgi:putative transposase